MPLTSKEIENKLFDMNDIIEELEPAFKFKKLGDVWVRIRFPYGVIRRAETFRAQHPIIRDRTLKTNIAYALQFANVYTWMLQWFSIGLTAKQMLIKHGVVLFTSIMEALTHYFVDNYLRQENVHKRFKKNLEKLKNNGVVDDDELDELNRCRRVRDKIHLQIQFAREWEEYEESDYYSAFECMNNLNKKLTAWVKSRR